MIVRKAIAATANLAALLLVVAAATGEGPGIAHAIAAELPPLPSLSLSMSLPSLMSSMVSVAEPSSLALLATALGAASFGVARLRRSRNPS